MTDAGWTTVAIGKFDALHRGHQALAAAGEDPVLLSFTGMAEALGWAERLPLVAPGDRPRILDAWSAALGHRVREAHLPFARIRGRDAREFLALLQADHGTRVVIIGDDFRGGRDRRADAATFAAEGAALGLAIRIVASVADASGPISSSRARTLLAEGRVVDAANVLGRRHRLIGRVARGDGRGRTIGIPTANLVEPANAVPGPGVYAGQAIVDHAPIPAVINIGRLPTIGSDRPQTVEAHLIGFTGDLYDQPLAIEFDRRLRDEQRFASLEALVEQIRRDIAEAMTSRNAEA
jgi:riboflavin kinase/FMN adenylyltransferase